MNMTVAFRWISGFFFLLSFSTGQAVELAASSSFNMVLGPIPSRLDLMDLQVVEDAIATAIFTLVAGMTDFLDIEAVIQESDFLDSRQSFTSSQIRFFVLATTVDTAKSPRVELNQLITDSLFELDAGRNSFFRFLAPEQLY
jgi:hypothetical protein